MYLDLFFIVKMYFSQHSQTGDQLTCLSANCQLFYTQVLHMQTFCESDPLFSTYFDAHSAYG